MTERERGQHARPETSRPRLSQRPIGKLLVMAVLAVSIMFVLAPPASSDIGACADVEPPRTEAQALSRAFYAFDGVVVGGRTVRDPATGRNVLVSPLTFRVIRNLKLDVDVADYGRRRPSGELVITMWDAKYAHTAREFERGTPSLKRRVLHHQGPDVRLPGELATERGARWRIYGTFQVGNWTATTCMGSHPLQGSAPRTPPGSGFPSPRLWLPVGLCAVAIALLGWRARRSKRYATRGRGSI
jgi:hypothetical protein